MPRRLLTLALLAAIAGLIAAICLVAMMSAGTDAEDGPVYAPSTIVAGLARRPAAWLGRTVRVEGQVISGNAATFSVYCARSRPCPSFPNSTAALWNGGLGDGADAIPRGEVLPLTIAPEDPLRALLRRVPLVRDHIAPPQRLDVLTLHIYRVQLLTAPCAFPPRQVCYEARLLDGAARQPP